jgi:hypothetical protein
MVGALLDSCMRYNHLKYLIKWKGYNASHIKWEVHWQIHAQSKIVMLHCNNPGAAQYTYQCGHILLHPIHQSWPSNLLEILACHDNMPLKGGWYKGTSILFLLLLLCPLLSPLSISSSLTSCIYLTFWQWLTSNYMLTVNNHVIYHWSMTLPNSVASTTNLSHLPLTHWPRPMWCDPI